MKFSTYTLTFFFSLSFSALIGQVTEDTLTNYDPANPTHLIIAYEEASQSIRVVRNKLLTSFNVTPIKNGYEAIQDRLDIYRRIGDYNLQGASLNRMNDLISIFERQLVNLEGWQESLLEITKELSDFKIQLVKHRERLAQDPSGFDDLQQQYYETRHVPLINQADSLNGLVENKLEEVLKLELDISQDYAHLFNRIQDLKAYVALYWDHMMRKEEVNWKLSGGDESNLLSGSGNRFTSTVWRITDFFKINISKVVYLLIIFAGSIFLLRRIKNEDKKRSNEDVRHPGLYQHPIAISSLLAGMMFPLIFPPTTSLMYDFALLASYLPFLYILHSNLEAKHFRTYVIFLFFLLILKVQSIFSGSSGFFAIVMIACAAFFIYTILSQSLRKYFNIRWQWIGIFNWLLAAILLVGVVCILFQRIQLGGILINGAGETIAFALVLLYFGNWFDQLLDFLRQKSSFQNLATDKVRLEEFWHTWSNRIYIVLLVLFVISFLKNFSLYSNTKDAVLLFFNDPRVLGDLTFTYGGIALFILVIYFSSKISSTIKFLAEDKSYYKNRKETANIAVIMRFFLVTVGFILALLVSGIPIDRITIIIGALSVGIGFGLQNVVNNLISGIILIFERPIQTGDLVELQQYTGFVKDIGIRSSVIRTYDGAEVIVPNGNLVSQEVINWTLSNRQRRVEIRVGVAYGSDAKEVTEVLRTVLESHQKVLKRPAPAVLLDGFGDNSVDFRLLFWTSDIDNWLTTRSELSTNIYNALDEAGISIPFPQRDIHVISWEAPNTAIKLPDPDDANPQAPAPSDTKLSDDIDSKIGDEPSGSDEDSEG